MTPFRCAQRYLAIMAPMVLVALTASHSGKAASFQGIGGLVPTTATLSDAYAVSANGQVVVGRTVDSGSTQVPFRWTSAGGMVGLGQLPNAPANADAGEGYGVSADGTYVVGRSRSDIGTEGYIWHSSTGMVGLGGLPGATGQSSARAVSATGDSIAGWAKSPNNQTRAVLWKEGQTATELPILSSSYISSVATSVSYDGGLIVGWVSDGNLSQAVRWTDSGSVTGLGHLSLVLEKSSAQAISGDGAWIVGNSFLDGETRGFRWSSQSGMTEIPDFNDALAISADGSVIGGVNNSGLSGAMLWTEEGGSRLVSDILSSDFGIDLSGWQLTRVDGLSANGQVVVGQGVNPNGQSESWIAVVPEPSTGLLLATGILGLALRRRSH